MPEPSLGALAEPLPYFPAGSPFPAGQAALSNRQLVVTRISFDSSPKYAGGLRRACSVVLRGRRRLGAVSDLVACSPVGRRPKAARGNTLRYLLNVELTCFLVLHLASPPLTLA